MRRFLLALALGAFAVPAMLSAQGVDSAQAFDRLKDLAGAWSGVAHGEGGEAEEADGMAVRHEFRVSAAGTVVMETMDPGGAHEMINMYHLDGEDLVLTHYCAGGNQPTMRLSRADSTPDHLVFDFTGGTNLDASTDGHIHDAALTFEENGGLVSAWNAWGGGEQVASMVFALERAE